jgi:hypothetical protein
MSDEINKAISLPLIMHDFNGQKITHEEIRKRIHDHMFNEDGLLRVREETPEEARQSELNYAFREKGDLEKAIREERCDAWVNPYRTITDLPLSPAQKECVVEYLAWQLIELLEAITGSDPCGKTYDPLFIQDGTAHSYAFDLWDGGRHHKFESLEQVEEGMRKEVIERIAKHIRARRIIE